jgi:hypothetical protein
LGWLPDQGLQPSRPDAAIKNDFTRLNSNLMVVAGRLTIFNLDGHKSRSGNIALRFEGA